MESQFLKWKRRPLLHPAKSDDSFDSALPSQATWSKWIKTDDFTIQNFMNSEKKAFPNVQKPYAANFTLKEIKPEIIEEEESFFE